MYPEIAYNTRTQRLTIFSVGLRAAILVLSNSWRSRIAQNGRLGEVGTPLPADSSIIALDTRFARAFFFFSFFFLNAGTELKNNQEVNDKFEEF